MALYKYLNRRLKKHRALKLGIPYEDDVERNLRLLREDKLPDGTCLAAATPEEIDFAKRDGLGGGIDWKNWRKYFTQEHWTLRKLSKSAVCCFQASRSNDFSIVSLSITMAVITLLILVLVFQDSIVTWLAPIGTKWKRCRSAFLICCLTSGCSQTTSLPGGWLIPIAILVVQSFPPV